MVETKKAAPGVARLTLVLFAITAITALLLGLVNYITQDRISQANALKKAEAMAEVMPGVERFTKLDLVTGDLVTGAFRAEDQGYVITVAPSGYAGPIEMVVGLNNDLAVTGVSIVAMSETQNLGAKADEEEFRGQYIGKSGPFAVDKDGGDIDSITGATITTRAVTNGINAAIEAAAGLSQEGFE